jgi:hypothetical protein
LHDQSLTADYFKKMTKKCQLHDMTTIQNCDNFYFSFLGRPGFKGDSVATAAFNAANSRSRISTTPTRRSSLFFTSNPAFKQFFFTSPSTAYSISGIVKLSRINFAFLTFSFASGVVTGTGILFGNAIGGLAFAFAGTLTGGLAGNFARAAGATTSDFARLALTGTDLAATTGFTAVATVGFTDAEADGLVLAVALAAGFFANVFGAVSVVIFSLIFH